MSGMWTSNHDSQDTGGKKYKEFKKKA